MSVGQRTVVCVLTPQGRGAVAVVSVEGDTAAEAVGRFFQPINRSTMSNQPLDRILYGHWVGADAEGSQGEDLVVCRRSKSKWEIHCHGGTQSSAQVVSDLTSAGCEEIDDLQWLTQEHGCPIKAAAHQSLSLATTHRTASILLDQFHGALRREIESILVELEAGNAIEAELRIDRLLELSDFGLHLTKPWQVVIAGRPNVGKSRLINALVGFERAIVFDQPGTTRDVVTATTAVDGWPIELSDTAGLHATSDEIEAAGIELARERLATADLVIWVLNAVELSSRGMVDYQQLAEQQAAEVGAALDKQKTLTVINKADLATHSHKVGLSILVTSAVTGAGIKQLLDGMVKRLVPEVPLRESAVLFTRQQVGLLRSASESSESLATLNRLLR